MQYLPNQILLLEVGTGLVFKIKLENNVNINSESSITLKIIFSHLFWFNFKQIYKSLYLLEKEGKLCIFTNLTN
jgi:hypothetical protein